MQKDLKYITDFIDKGLSRILKKLDKIERRQLMKKDIIALEDKIDTFIYMIKRLEIQQQILEEQIAEMQKSTKTSPHN